MKNYRSTFRMILVTFSCAIGATTILPMNRAFLALTDLLPYMQDHTRFMDQRNESAIKARLQDLGKTFKTARHDTLLKHDLFSPSYDLIRENVDESIRAFESGKKDFAHWNLRELTNLCMDCHTRLPPSHVSSFQTGELRLERRSFATAYDLGLAQMMVRRYVDAKNNFDRDIQDRLIRKDTRGLLLPFQQILLIETKVFKDPQAMELILDRYLKNESIPEVFKKTLRSWSKGLSRWKESSMLNQDMASDKALKLFIQKKLIPMRTSGSADESIKVDLLFASGVLSNFFFHHPDSALAPELSYWLGWIEKRLKEDAFFASGDYFLKQCIKKYPKHPVAKDCLKEYKESVEFNFSGSGGLSIPEEIKQEIRNLEAIIRG